MDKELDNRVIKDRQRKRWLYGLGVLILLLGFMWFLRKTLAPTLKQSDLIIGEVKSGEMENTISANGMVEPSSEIVLVSPLSAKISKVIRDNGTEIKAGDPILVLDTEYTELEFQRLKDELKLKDNNVVRLQLELEKNIRDIEIDDKIKDLQVKNLQSLLSDAKRLKTVGGMTQEEVDKAQQNLAIARLEKSKLENELKYRKESIASSVLNEKIESSIQKKRLDELAKKLKNSTITAEVSGIITWLDNRIGTQVQEGDPLVRLANVSSYRIDAQVSDMHSEKIVIGQQVQVELNDAVETGTIEQILPAVENNTIQFKVKLNNANSDKLRPKMKGALRIVTNTKSKSLYIPNGSGISGGKSQKVFVIKNGKAEARTVEFGFRTSDKVEVISGLSAGEKVIISDMSLYKDKSVVNIK